MRYKSQWVIQCYIYIYIYIYSFFFIIQRVKALAIPCPHQPPTRGDNTVSAAQGGAAIPGATTQILPPDRVLRELYIYIYIYARSIKIWYIYIEREREVNIYIYIYIYIYIISKYILVYSHIFNSMNAFRWRLVSCPLYTAVIMQERKFSRNKKRTQKR